MNDVGDLLQVGLGIIGIVAALAAVLAFFKSSYAEARIKALQQDRDDLQARVTRVEKKEAETRAELIVAEKKVEVLENIVTGRDELKRLGDEIAAHDDRTAEEYTILLRRLDALAGLIREKRDGTA